MDGNGRDYRVRSAIPLSRRSEREDHDPQELAYLRFLAKKLNFELVARYRLPPVQSVVEDLLHEHSELQNLLELDYDQKRPSRDGDDLWILSPAMEHETVELIHRELPGLLHDLRKDHGIEAIVELRFESNGDQPTIHLSNSTGELLWSELPPKARKSSTQRRK